MHRSLGAVTPQQTRIPCKTGEGLLKIRGVCHSQCGASGLLQTVKPELPDTYRRFLQPADSALLINGGVRFVCRSE